MAQITTLKDRDGGGTLYPLTSTEAVFDPQGRDLETRLEAERARTTADLAPLATRDELTRGLAAKQGKLTTTDDLRISASGEIGLSDTEKGRCLTPNLLTGTRDFSGQWRTTGQWERDDTDFMGLAVMRGSNEFKGMFQDFTIQPGRDYTFSAWVKCLSPLPPDPVIGLWTGNSQDIAPENSRYFTDALADGGWHRLAIVFRAKGDTPVTARCRVESSVAGNSIAFCGYKLEEGANPRPQWSPATEEIALGTDIETARRALFDDMWRQAVGEWGDIDHTHTENGISKPYGIDELHLTYDEALETMDFGHLVYGSQQQYSYAASLRVNLPPVFGHNSNFIGTQTFTSSSVEVAILAHDVGGFLLTAIHPNAFRGCKNLRKIATTLREPSSAVAGQPVSFSDCPKLEELRIKYIEHDIDLSDSPLLSLASLRFLVDNAANTSAITVTVHPDVYAKLTGDTANEAAEALTPEELAQWQQLLTDAIAKNIVFATTS